MGVNGCSATQTTPPSALTSKPQGQRSCCGLIGLQTATILIALFELIFFLYQIFSTSMSYDKTGDEYALAFALTLFSFVLCIVAVTLLLVGLKKRSPYFLVPHLLMQFAILSSTFLLAIYFTLLLVGGTSIKVDAIFYEDSPRGELGLAQSSRLPPVKAEIIAHGLNTLLIALLVLTVIFFLFQLWLFFDS
uniref:MARVEL domain-containing protein n=1 Tax=Ditylenchus dipsaci TaxID=166011 RepID=A0A915DP65_9BILA